MPLTPVPGGFHAAVVDDCPPGTRYRYRLAGADGALADPASRWQPDGVHGPSAVFDPAAHQWGDGGFVAPPLGRYVIYELHVGTFTADGAFDAATAHLAELAALGVTAVEVMPVAQFPGRWNWGYDGVFPYAVQDSYGGPAGLQRFVDACHGHGLAVVLDVVYNHLGPEGNMLGAYGPYFTDRYRTPWGAAVNVDGPDSDAVRRYFVDNAVQWFGDFHVDALRLDAVHGIVDPTATPFLADLSAACEATSEDLGRRCPLLAESADNNPRVVTARSAGGLGMDAQWNDDFHHALHAAVTGERTGYYRDFGGLDQLATALSDGFVYQGQYSAFRRRRHGAPSAGVDPVRWVVFGQNHDQVGNRPAGDRLSSLVGPDRLALGAAVLLLAPGIPLLFMGEEYGETNPFPYFVDHQDPDLREAVRRGRAEEMASYDLAGVAMLDPTSPATRDAAVLDRSRADAGLRQLYADLLALRRTHPALVPATRPDAVAWAAGSVLTLRRSSAGYRLAVLANFADHPVEAALPDGDWTLVPGAAWAGRGVERVDAGTVTLAGLAFGIFEGS